MVLCYSTYCFGNNQIPQSYKDYSDETAYQERQQQRVISAPLRDGPDSILSGENDEAYTSNKEEELVRDPWMERFGSRFFQRRDLPPSPVEAMLIPENYRLGPGDQLRVIVFGKQPSNTVLTVDQQGRLPLPGLGSVSLGGLTFDKASRIIELKADERTVGTEVIVTLERLRQISVIVAGEVLKPGRHNISSLSTITDALLASGGISELGSYRKVSLRRGGKTHSTLDLYELLANGDQSGDTNLKNGDLIFVPTASTLVSIEGEVLRPAIYELISGETFADALGLAGGLAKSAFRSNFQLIRADEKSSTPILLTIPSAESQLVLQNGDTLRVDRMTDEIKNRVKLSGGWVRTGLFEFIPGSKLSNYLHDSSRDLIQDSDLRIGLIVRQTNLQRDIEILAFSPSLVLSGDPVADLSLRPLDEVLILPLSRVNEGQRDGSSGELFANVIGPREGRSGESRLGESRLGFSRKGTRESESSIEFQKNEREFGEKKLSKRELLAPIVARLSAQARSAVPAKIVKISGAINEPGDYPLPSNAGISQLIDLAGGVQNGGFLGKVEVRRSEISSSGVKIAIEEHDLSLGSRDKYRPRPADQIRINYLPGWTQGGTVAIEGEVVFPGDYALAPGDTISKLLDRAGGFTDDAFIEGTRYISQAAKQQQLQAILRFTDDVRKANLRNGVAEGQLAFDSSDYANQFSEKVEGRVVVDMGRILVGDPSSDLLLQNEDRLIVPKRSQTVFVVGEVLEPGSYRHEEARSLDDYISLAAGYSEIAKKKNTYVIEPDGSVRRPRNTRNLFKFSDGSQSMSAIQPGSTIVVPPDFDYSTPLELYTRVSSVVFQSVASLAAFLSLARN